MIDAEQLLAEAVRHFWRVRAAQSKKQGTKSGAKDAGNRAAVTGGKHADGFVELIAAVIRDAEMPNFELLVHTRIKKHRTLPGYFRPCKEWDVVIMSGTDLIAVVEIKSQVGSFGNNFNNRVEEALGSATDFWTAYKYGAFKPSVKPWLGYFVMLEHHPKSVRKSKRTELKPFSVDESLQQLSYVERYQALCRRMMRELLYDAACLVTSDSGGGKLGRFIQPDAELTVRNFATSLHARANAFARVR